MKTIYFNSAVAKRCGKNGIIKAVLLNYVYNFHKQNVRKGAGHPAFISLAEFVYQYKVDDGGLWERSFIHENLKEMEKAGLLINTPENKMPVYSVSSKIDSLLTAKDAVVVSFDLGEAYEHGIHVAIMKPYLLHAIEQSPDRIAYNLSVKRMSEVNRLSPSQIYKAIQFLKDAKVIRPTKSPVQKYSRKMCLTGY